MALAYNLWTDEDVKNRNVVEKGKYAFKIVAATSKKTQGGLDKNGKQKPIRDMLEIDFEFTDQNGVIKKTKDWIVFVENMDWKLRHLANTTGTLELYEAKTLDVQHLTNKTGFFELGIKDFTDKYGTEKKSNFVVDYQKKEDVVQAKNDQFVDSDIPF